MPSDSSPHCWGTAVTTDQRPASFVPTGRLAVGPWHPSLAAAAVWITILVVVLVSLLVAPDIVAPSHWSVLLRQAAPLGLVAIGQTVLVIGRGFDLSVGGVVGFVGVFAAGSFAQNNPTVLTLLLCLGIGVVVGLANGLMVAWAGLSPLVVTLATGFVLSGAMLIYTGGAPMGSVPPSIRAVAGPGPFGFSWSTYIWLAVALLTAMMLTFMWCGRWLYALGGRPEAARLAGVRVGGVQLASHVFASVCAAAGGIMLAGFVGSGSLGAGQDLILNSLAATVIGGTTLAGGRGGVSGTVGGAVLLTIIAAVLTGVGLGKPGELLTQGIIIVIAAALFRRGRTDQGNEL